MVRPPAVRELFRCGRAHRQHACMHQGMCRAHSRKQGARPRARSTGGCAPPARVRGCSSRAVRARLPRWTPVHPPAAMALLPPRCDPLLLPSPHRPLAIPGQPVPAGAYDNVSYCTRCHDIKPPGAHHCTACARWVERRVEQGMGGAHGTTLQHRRALRLKVLCAGRPSAPSINLCCPPYLSLCTCPCGAHNRRGADHAHPQAAVPVWVGVMLNWPLPRHY